MWMCPTLKSLELKNPRERDVDEDAVDTVVSSCRMTATEGKNMGGVGFIHVGEGGASNN